MMVYHLHQKHSVNKVDRIRLEAKKSQTLSLENEKIMTKEKKGKRNM